MPVDQREIAPGSRKDAVNIGRLAEREFGSYGQSKTTDGGRYVCRRYGIGRCRRVGAYVRDGTRRRR